MSDYTDYDRHWQGVGDAYTMITTVHDFMNGHREVLIQRWDRFKPDPRWPGVALPQKSQAEKDAANAERSARRAKTQVRRKVKMMGLDQLLTLTYKANQTDENLCKEHMKEFIRRLRREIPDFRYVAGFERQERGAWHVHMAVQRIQPHYMRNGIRVKSYDLIRAVWRSVVGDLDPLAPPF